MKRGAPALRDGARRLDTDSGVRRTKHRARRRAPLRSGGGPGSGLALG